VARLNLSIDRRISASGRPATIDRALPREGRDATPTGPSRLESHRRI